LLLCRKLRFDEKSITLNIYESHRGKLCYMREKSSYIDYNKITEHSKKALFFNVDFSFFII